jgi:hypothetical protein
MAPFHQHVDQAAADEPAPAYDQDVQGIPDIQRISSIFRTIDRPSASMRAR